MNPAVRSVRAGLFQNGVEFGKLYSGMMQPVPRISVKPAEVDFGRIGRSVPAMERNANPMAKFGHQFSMAADKHHMSVDHCILYLARRVCETAQAQRRAGHLFGRMVNWGAGVRAQQVELSGAVLAGVMRYLGDAVPASFDRGLDYYVRFDVADDLLSRLKTKAKTEGRIK